MKTDQKTSLVGKEQEEKMVSQFFTRELAPEQEKRKHNDEVIVEVHCKYDWRGGENHGLDSIVSRDMCARVYARVCFVLAPKSMQKLEYFIRLFA